MRWPLPIGLLLFYSDRVGFLLLILFLLSSGTAYAQNPSVRSPWTVTYSDKDLAQAGVTRLSDLFLLIDNSAAYSVDGYTWYAALGQLSPSSENGWLLVIDGVPQNFGTFGLQNINQAPFHITDVAHITIIRVPTLVQGTFAKAGTIHIRTKNPPSGIAFKGSAAAGNEINDPGPFRFIDSTQVNIDRVGPPLYTALSLGIRKGSLKASFASDEHHATDIMMIRRVQKLHLDTRRPQLRLRAPRVSATFKALGGTHRFIRSRSRLEDLRFFEPLGLEIPNTSVHDHISGSGTIGDSTRSFSYRASYDRVHLGYRLSRTDIDFDWLQERYALHASQHMHWGSWQNETGITLRSRRSHTSSILLYDTLFETEGYTSWHWHASASSYHQIAGFFTLTNNEFGYKALASGAQSLSPTTVLHYTFSHERTAFEAMNSLWFWARNGYTFLLEQGADFILPLRFSHPETTTLDIALSVRPSKGLGFTFGLFERRFRGVTVPQYTFVYNPSSDGFTPATTVVSGLAGRVIGYEATLHARPFAWMSHRLSYTASFPSSPDVAFVSLWHQHPRYQTTLTTRLTLPSRLQAFVRWHYTGSNRWLSYQSADRATTGRFATDRPAYLLLDLGLHKSLWGPRMQASLVLRNALDAPYRPHPAGAALHATLFAQVSLDIAAVRW